jgi:hypothetical protein
VALEALRDAWRSKRLKLDELNRIAKALRVQRVMQRYLAPQRSACRHPSQQLTTSPCSATRNMLFDGR